MRADHSRKATRPGLIILVGVAVIALLLVVVVMLPPPRLQSVLHELVPRNATLQSQVHSDNLAGIYCTTSESLANVADFYRKRLTMFRGPDRWRWDYDVGERWIVRTTGRRSYALWHR